jgi:16S rRNA (guanine1207-N2)-methyltransferase
MSNHFRNPFENLQLNRYPYSSDKTLRAWDAADEYLLNYLFTEKIDLSNMKILIFNDSFGALPLSLQQYNPTYVTDSLLSQIGTEKNRHLNHINSENIKFIDSLSIPNIYFDLLLIKVPKTLDFLQDYLIKIKPLLKDNCIIIVAGMIKTTPKSVWKILEKTLGKTSTSLAKKKARLIFVKLEEKVINSSYPVIFIQENTNYAIYNHSNVFSKKSLDIGTRFLLENLPRYENVKSIIDLGCGNGIVGLNLAKTHPNATVTFIDESFMAIASAKLTIENNISSKHSHQFIVNDCLDKIEANSVDLIVCNPPFHQSHSVGIDIAMKMFKQAHKTLKSKGHFIVVANRHLPYSSQLKRIFGKVQKQNSNSKFNIYAMIKNN